MSFESSWLHVIEIACGALIYLLGYRHGRRKGAERERVRVAVMIGKTLGVLWSPTLHQILVWLDGNQTAEQLLAHTQYDADERKARKILDR